MRINRIILDTHIQEITPNSGENILRPTRACTLPSTFQAPLSPVYKDLHDSVADKSGRKYTHNLSFCSCIFLCMQYMG